MTQDTACEVEVIELTQEQAEQAFDELAQREMGISREEFLRRFDAGEWTEVDPDSVPGLVDVMLALPLVR